MANIQGTAIRGLPGKLGANTRGPVRASPYGELVTAEIGESRYTVADQGNYYTAHNTTNDAASTLLGHAAPILADADATLTKPFIFARMNPSSGLRAYLDFIEIDVIVAGANGTRSNWAAQLDTGATRVTTAGTALTQVNSNMQAGAAATGDLAVQGGVIVVGAETASCRNLGFGQLRGAIEFAGDRTVFRFGDEPSSGENVVIGAQSRHTVNMPPVILGPSDSFLLALYAALDLQDTAGVYKVRMGWWEL